MWWQVLEEVKGEEALEEAAVGVEEEAGEQAESKRIKLIRFVFYLWKKKLKGILH